MSATVTYKGSTLVTVDNTTKTLKTAGKYLEGDVIITDVSTSQGVVVTEEIDEGGGIIKHITAVEIAGTKEITANGTYDVTSFANAYVNVAGGGSTINNQNKTVTPTTSQQTVTADSGYTGLGTVTVNAMPSGTAGTPSANKGTVSNHSISVTPSVTNTTGYISGGTKTGTAVTVSASELVSGTLSITSNGTKDVTNYASVNVNVPTGSTINNQNKTVNPTTSQQSITADSGYTGLGTVTVNAMNIQSLTVTPSETEQVFNVGQSTIYINNKSVGMTGIGPLPSGTYKIDWKGLYDNQSYQPDTGTVYFEFDGSTPVNVYLTTESNYIKVSSTTTNLYFVQWDTLRYSLTKVDLTDGYAPVTVEAISSTYVGSGITKRSSSDLTTSGATVTVPAGYYSAQASKAVSSMTLPTSASSTSSGTSKATIGRSTSAQYINIPTGYNGTAAYYTISATPNGAVTAPASISGTSATVSTGTNTLTLTKTVSVTPNVTTAGYISSGTAGNSSVSLTASVTTKAAATITPTTTNQTIASGTYLTGTQTIAGDSNLVGSNILSGKSIFGVVGTVAFQTIHQGSSAPASSLGVNGDVYIQV